MTDRVKRQLAVLNAREYRFRRVDPPVAPTAADARFSEHTCASEAARFAYAASCEKEAVFHGEEDLFGFNRYCKGALGETRFGNVVIDYQTVLSGGLSSILAEIDARRADADEEPLAYYDAVEVSYDACFRLAEMYRAAAEKRGCARLVAALTQIPRYGARDYYEALVFLRFLSYGLRLARCTHMPLGRFDVYMKPYYEASLSRGASEEELLELTELFFISMNFDTDLYFGIQKGDNGQSLVLGGCDREGNEVFGPLSELCLTASEELALIDPKINLRVTKDTPLSLYERGTRLTRQGLGFPQYTNDDVAIPYLTSLGYELPDARDYAVAACWELITSGRGAEIVNMAVLSFPDTVDRALRRTLPTAKDFDAVLAAVREEIGKDASRIEAYCNAQREIPVPLLSSFLSPTVERGRDLASLGARYNNFGIHGAGIANAADALCAVREGVFVRGEMTGDTLLSALDADFAGYEALRERLLSYPKMGQNDDSVDALADFLVRCAADALHGKPNARGGVFRVGTGTAHEYYYTAKRLGATADGRRAYAPFSANYSSAPTARTLGPLSAIKSFTKTDLSRAANGGPFTVEIHDTVFRNDEGEKKVAALVKTFFDLGGHQMQINAVNRDVLLDAKAHPENYPGLIVRVWGWSGYFCELEPAFQDHIIRRVEFTV